MSISPARRQKHAIHVLRLYLSEGQEISRRISEASPITVDGELLHDHQVSFASELARAAVKLKEARHDLLNSGYDTPDAWLTFPTDGTTLETIESERAIAWIVSPEAESEWAAVLKSMDAALIRLDATLANEADKGGLVTIKEIASIAAEASEKGVREIATKSPLPSPIVPKAGSRAAKYSYSDVRAWAIANWPARREEFPSTFAEAQKKLGLDAKNK